MAASDRRTGLIAFLRSMKRFLFSALLLASTGLALAQVGGAWFVDKDGSQPVVVKQGYVWQFKRFDMSLDGLMRPTDAVRLGGALNFSFSLGNPVSNGEQVELRGLVGIGSLFGDRLDNLFKQMRPGLVLGLTVKF